MGSLFDTEVYQRRNHTPWANVSFRGFVRDMIWHGSDDPMNNQVILTAHYRPDVSSRAWYNLEWTGEDGERHSASSQDFDLLLWRAAEIEIKARERYERERQQAKGISPG